MLKINDNLIIPAAELSFSYVKASGSGGQKVNKTSSQVQLRWNLLESSVFSEGQKVFLQKKLSSKLTTGGDLIVTSESARSQHQNKQDCLEKLAEILQKALHKPKPRKKTKPTRASKEKRIKNKKIKSEIKNQRKKVKY